MRRLVALAFTVGVCAVGLAGALGPHAATNPIPRGIHKIKHVVVIMQENRSFDTYFGTYPGAEGLPPNVCVPDAANGGCQKPFHDTADLNYGGPHGQANATADIDGGKMDGFVSQAEKAQVQSCKTNPNNPACSRNAAHPDVMGYHDQHEIPNYWAYARNFVLHDHMFEPNASWSLPEHLFMVSEWSAKCSVPHDPMSCVNALQNPAPPPDQASNKNHVPPDYAWTDLTYLLHRQHVSWRYYVFTGTEPDCEEDEMICGTVKQNAKTPGIWNPLPFFDTVQPDGQLQNMTTFSAAVASIRGPTAGLIRAPTCPRTPRCSAISSTTSTSRRSRARRWCSRSTPSSD